MAAQARYMYCPGGAMRLACGQPAANVSPFALNDYFGNTIAGAPITNITQALPGVVRLIT